MPKSKEFISSDSDSEVEPSPKKRKHEKESKAKESSSKDDSSCKLVPTNLNQTRKLDY